MLLLVREMVCDRAGVNYTHATWKNKLKMRRDKKKEEIRRR